MRYLLVLCLLVLCPVALAVPLGDSAFDARLLTGPEKRVLQAALTLTGDYHGQLDGIWGKASQSALEAHAMRTAGAVRPVNRHLVTLLAAFEAERDARGWTIETSTAGNLSFAYPAALVSATRHKDGMTWSSADGSFQMATGIVDAGKGRALHALVAADAAPPFEILRDIRPDRQTTFATVRDGHLRFARTDRLGADRYFSLTIIAAPVHRGRMALVAATIRRGAPVDLTLPADGLLSGILASGSQPQPVPEATPPMNPPSQPTHTGALLATGTGFFVNETAVVTAGHVVADCGRLTLADGTPLTLIARELTKDIAVARSDRASRHWLALSPERVVRLGEPVMALGHPYAEVLDLGLVATGGNVSALLAPGQSIEDLLFSAPVQPGNSGGPVLNRHGAVVGVVVSRLEDLAMLKGIGRQPQNMNYAVSHASLAAFLGRQGIAHAVAPARPVDLASGIPNEVALAVVAIYCFEK